MKPLGIFAIADIHGCCRTFRQMLFSQLQLNAADTLYLLGDFIDRGPDSKGVLETILELQSAGYDIRPIMGNHEAMLLQSIEPGAEESLHDWLENGGRATLKSYGAEHPADLPQEHVSFLRGLPLYSCTEQHIFVHAGLNFCVDDPFSREGEHAMLWDRYQFSDRKKQKGRTLVVGHTIRHEDEIKRSLKKAIITIDNGCYMGTAFEGRGALVAIELKSGNLVFQDNIESSY